MIQDLSSCLKSLWGNMAFYDNFQEEFLSVHNLIGEKTWQGTGISEVSGMGSKAIHRILHLYSWI